MTRFVAQLSFFNFEAVRQPHLSITNTRESRDICKFAFGFRPYVPATNTMGQMSSFVKPGLQTNPTEPKSSVCLPNSRERFQH